MTIRQLETHRDRLAAAQTFEEYRDAHVRYVDELIADYKARPPGRQLRRFWGWLFYSEEAPVYKMIYQIATKEMVADKIAAAQKSE